MLMNFCMAIWNFPHFNVIWYKLLEICVNFNEIGKIFALLSMAFQK